MFLKTTPKLLNKPKKFVISEKCWC